MYVLYAGFVFLTNTSAPPAPVRKVFSDSFFVYCEFKNQTIEMITILHPDQSIHEFKHTVQ